MEEREREREREDLIERAERVIETANQLALWRRDFAETLKPWAAGQPICRAKTVCSPMYTIKTRTKVLIAKAKDLLESSNELLRESQIMTRESERSRELARQIRSRNVL